MARVARVLFLLSLLLDVSRSWRASTSLRLRRNHGSTISASLQRKRQSPSDASTPTKFMVGSRSTRRNKLITGCGKDWRKALWLLSTYEAMPDALPDVFAYGAALGVCGRARRASVALVLLESMETKGIQPNAHCFNAALAACTRQPEQALTLLQSMPERGVSPNLRSFNAVLASCAAGLPPRPLDALALLEEMQGAPHNLAPDEFSLSTAMSACAKAGQWGQSLELLDAVPKAVPGLQPNAYCYSAAINGCMLGRQGKLARHLLDTMKSKGVPPTLVCVNGALSASARCGEWVEALDLLHCMPQSYGLKPDVYSYAAALDACDKASQWKSALQLLAVMRGSGATSGDILGGVNSSSLVLGTDTGVSNGGSSDSVQPNAHCYAAAIGACGRAGQWQKALQLLDSVEGATGLPPNVVCWNVAASACRFAGEWQAAVALRNRMADEASAAQAALCQFDVDDQSEPNTSSKRSVTAQAGHEATHLDGSRGGKSIESQDWLAQADGMPGSDLTYARSMEALEAAAVAMPDEGTYSAAIGACDAAGQVDEAVRLFVEARERGLFVAAWGQAAGKLMDKRSTSSSSSSSERTSKSRRSRRSQHKRHNSRRHGGPSRAVVVGQVFDQGAADSASAAVQLAEEKMSSKNSDTFALEIVDGRATSTMSASSARAGQRLVVDLRTCSSAVSRAAVRALVRDLEAGRMPLSGLAFLTGDDNAILKARCGNERVSVKSEKSPKINGSPLSRSSSEVAPDDGVESFPTSSGSGSAIGPPSDFESAQPAASTEPLLIACETMVELGRIAREAALKEDSSRGSNGASSGSSSSSTRRGRGLSEGLGEVVALGRNARSALEANLDDLALSSKLDGDKDGNGPQKAWLLLEDFVLGWLKSGKV